MKYAKGNTWIKERVSIQLTDLQLKKQQNALLVQILEYRTQRAVGSKEHKLGLKWIILKQNTSWTLGWSKAQTKCLIQNIAGVHAWLKHSWWLDIGLKQVLYDWTLVRNLVSGRICVLSHTWTVDLQKTPCSTAF